MNGRCVRGIVFATVLMVGAPSLALADYVVSVRSLKDVFLGNEPDQGFINALAANPVTVTVRDVQGLLDPVVITFNANQLKNKITVPTGNALTISVEFSCPGLRTARLDAMINVNSEFEVAMPLDPGQCFQCPSPPHRHRLFFRRR